MISLHALTSFILPAQSTLLKVLDQSTKSSQRPYNPSDPPSAAHFTAKIHPREKEVSSEVNAFFLNHWPFADAKSRKKFVAAGFSQVTCFYYPTALNDRISFACRLLTLLFLIDGKWHSCTSLHSRPIERIDAGMARFSDTVLL